MSAREPWNRIPLFLILVAMVSLVACAQDTSHAQQDEARRRPGGGPSRG